MPHHSFPSRTHQGLSCFLQWRFVPPEHVLRYPFNRKELIVDGSGLPSSYHNSELPKGPSKCVRTCRTGYRVFLAMLSFCVPFKHIDIMLRLKSPGVPGRRELSIRPEVWQARQCNDYKRWTSFLFAACLSLQAGPAAFNLPLCDLVTCWVREDNDSHVISGCSHRSCVFGFL